jgi:hypothetical protein
MPSDIWYTTAGELHRIRIEIEYINDSAAVSSSLVLPRFGAATHPFRMNNPHTRVRVAGSASRLAEKCGYAGTEPTTSTYKRGLLPWCLNLGAVHSFHSPAEVDLTVGRAGLKPIRPVGRSPQQHSHGSPTWLMAYFL